MIKIKTTYTKENFLEFQKFHFFHRSKARVIFSIFGILFCILGLLCFLFQDYELAIVELVLGIILLTEFNTSLIPKIQAKYILKTDSMLIGLENEFIFYDDHIEILNKRSNSNIPYNEIYCYSETNDYYYIYINRMSAFIIQKENEELGKLLKEKVRKK